MAMMTKRGVEDAMNGGLLSGSKYILASAAPGGPADDQAVMATVEESARRMLRHYKAAADKAGASYAFDDPSKGVTSELGDDGKVTVTMRGPLDGGWFGPSAQEVIEAFGNAQAVHLIIDSPGGFLGEGMSVYSEMRSRADKGVTFTTEGRALVASAAVLPFLAGDERALGDGTMIMVHNPFMGMFLFGDVEDFERESGRAINALRSLTSNYVEILSRRTGLTVETARAAMAAETWYSVAEAEAAGYLKPLDDSETVASATQRMAASILTRFAEVK